MIVLPAARASSRARVLNRPRHQAQPGALPPEGVRHAGMVDDDLRIADLAERHLGFLARRRADEVAPLRGCLLEVDFGLDPGFVAHAGAPAVD
jgi:hypothetical protein